MAAPRTHTSAALHALLTLPDELRACVDESMMRDARSLSMSPHDVPPDRSRVSMTAHLREVLNERGMMSVWRRHFQESRFVATPRVITHDDLEPIYGAAAHG